MIKKIVSAEHDFIFTSETKFHEIEELICFNYQVTAKDIYNEYLDKIKVEQNKLMEGISIGTYKAHILKIIDPQFRIDSELQNLELPRKIEYLEKVINNILKLNRDNETLAENVTSGNFKKVSNFHRRCFQHKIRRDYLNNYIPHFSYYYYDIIRVQKEFYKKSLLVTKRFESKGKNMTFGKVAENIQYLIHSFIVETIQNIETENYCTKLLNELQGNSALSTDKSPAQPKLKWKGTAAQFGYIIQELVGKEFIEKPTGSYAKDAEFYLQHFEIEGKITTLTKEISPAENQNSLSAKNRTKIIIPNIKTLS
jgi:hypothetical protein